jgi:hypothetical protein
MMNDDAHLKVNLKLTNWQKKHSWQQINLTNAAEQIRAKIPASALRSGHAGLYLSARAHDSNGDVWFLPWLDVEDPEQHHDSIQANIQAAQRLYLQLEDIGLAHGLEVMLTGKAFRFVWPFVIGPQWAKAFKAFVNDKRGFPGIDPAPQTSQNAWLRVLAYRGNSAQGRPTMDRHIHLLDHPAHILDLNEQKYLALVSGRPDPALCLGWLNRIMPVNTNPTQEWAAVLDHYKRLVKLRSNIVKLSFPKEEKAGVNWERIEDSLTSSGIQLREMQVGDETIYRLSECPMCGRQDGNPWVTRGGRLKCHHANTCPAGEMKQDLQSNLFRPGLPAEKWVDGYQGMAEDQNNKNYIEPKTDIETARQRIRDTIQGDGDVLIRAAAGVGKTHTALEEALPMTQGQLVLLTVPKGSNIEEVYQKALELAPESVEIRKIRGRTRGEKKDAFDFNHAAGSTCYKMDFVDEVAKRGFKPGLICCPECEYYDECPYQEQFRDFPKTGLIIAAHEKASSLPKMPDLWIIDENPVKSLLQTKTVLPGAMSQIRSKLPGQSRQAIDAIRAQGDGLLHEVQGKPHHQGRIYATEPPAEWKDTETLWTQADIEDKRDPLARDMAYFDQLSDENLRKWQKRLYYGEKVDFAALEWIWTATGEQSGVAYIRAKPDRKDPIAYVLHSTKAPQLVRVDSKGNEHKTRIVALDATGDLAELQALFPSRDFQEVSADVALPGRRIHLKYALGKQSVCGDGNRKTPMADQHIRSKLKAGLRCLRDTERRILLVTFQKAEDRVLRIAKELDPGRTFEVTHFWGNAGLNCFEGCEAVICFGVPTVNPFGLKDIASSLFDDTEQQQTWIADQGRREVVQSVHRIRPIYSAKSIIIMGGFWPERLGPPQFSLNNYRQGGSLDLALDRLKPIARELGFMTREVACLSGVFCGPDTKHIADWMEAAKSLSEFLLFHIKNILIGNHKNSNGLLDPIQLKDSHAWDQLLDALQLELDLPELTVQQAHGAGRPSRGVGTIAAARKFYQEIEMPFDEDAWSGVETLAVQREARSIRRRVLPWPNVCGALDPKCVLDFPEHVPVYAPEPYLEAVG